MTCSDLGVGKQLKRSVCEIEPNNKKKDLEDYLMLVVRRVKTGESFTIAPLRRQNHRPKRSKPGLCPCRSWLHQ